MGEAVATTEFDPEDWHRYRARLATCLEVLAELLVSVEFAGAPSVGLELELNLVDADAEPVMVAAQVLEALADSRWQTELGRFNVEVNLDPRALGEGALSALEADLAGALAHLTAAAARTGARPAMIGILPTLRAEHLARAALTPEPRYLMLDQQIRAARGQPVHIELSGAEEVAFDFDTVAAEAACTSVQVHLRVAPEQFAATYNAAQAVAAVQVALGANAPFLFGRKLWAETRIPLFEQATDSRPAQLRATGGRPRVWFGERWITTVTDLFEENLRWFPALLPICSGPDPGQVRRSGAVPELAEMVLHNGTVWRWNRPVYAVCGGVPHLRVENRVLPAGPTVVDTVADVAFFLGLTRALATAANPVSERLPFRAALDNLRRAARHGITAPLRWPDTEQLPAAELALRALLPLAADGLSAAGVPAEQSARLLGVIEGRCVRRRNGARWQQEALTRLTEAGHDRDRALRELTRRYLTLSAAGEPVHTWPDL